jgi:hypothetical protein
MTTGSGIFPTNQSISDFKKGCSVTRPRGLGIGTGFRSTPSIAAPAKSQNTGQQSGEDLLDVIDGKKGIKVFFLLQYLKNVLFFEACLIWRSDSQKILTTSWRPSNIRRMFFMTYQP